MREKQKGILLDEGPKVLVAEDYDENVNGVGLRCCGSTGTRSHNQQESHKDMEESGSTLRP